MRLQTHTLKYFYDYLFLVKIVESFKNIFHKVPTQFTNFSIFRV